jgi:hypothetical protein
MLRLSAGNGDRLPSVGDIAGSEHNRHSGLTGTVKVTIFPPAYRTSSLEQKTSISRMYVIEEPKRPPIATVKRREPN